MREFRQASRRRTRNLAIASTIESMKTQVTAPAQEWAELKAYMRFIRARFSNAELSTQIGVPSYYLSIWASGQPRGLRAFHVKGIATARNAAGGIDRIVKMVVLAVRTNDRRTMRSAVRLLATFAKGASDAIDQDLDQIRHLKNDDSYWPRVMAVLLAVCCKSGGQDEVFSYANRMWDAANFGLSIPIHYRYEFRKIVLSAKRAVSESKMDEYVEFALRDLGLNMRSWKLKRYSYSKIAISEEILVGVMHSMGPGYTLVPGCRGGERFLIHDPQIDEQLSLGAAGNTMMLICREDYAIPAEQKVVAGLTLNRVLRRDSDAFNAPKVRLCDLDLLHSLQSKLVNIQRTSYFKTIATNWAVSGRFVLDESDTHDRMDDSNSLQAIEFTRSMNMRPAFEAASRHIGVMSLAITSDQYLVCMYQSGECVVSPDRWVPFGGSVDWDDIPHGRPTLGSLLTAGVNREVCEEAVIEANAVRSSVLIGHTLDVAHALKPDFFAVAFLRCEWREIEEHVEPIYGSQLGAALLNLDSEESFIDSVNAAVIQWTWGTASDFLLAIAYFLRRRYRLVLECIG